MTTAPPPAPPAFQDRRTGLTIFGALTILFGGVCALLVVLMFAGLAMAPPVPGNPAPPPMQTLLPATMIYGGLSVALIWLGIGSLFARRWARALLLIFSWSCLLTGVVTIAAMLFLLPPMLASIQPPGAPAALPPGAMQGILFTVAVIAGFFLVVIPGVWILFYQSRHVQATCEARNPEPSWTDACPLPVLAVSLWLALSVPMILMTSVSYAAVLPFFGVFLTGWAGTLGYLAMAGLWAMAAWAIYRLDRRGWWLTVIAFILFTVSNFVTYSRQDLATMYELMRLPAAQVAQIKSMPFLSGGSMKWMTSAVLFPFLGYLLWIRRYFPRPA